MNGRASEWLEQAKRDLELARLAQKTGSHEWACLAAHQSVVRSVQALLTSYGASGRGHSITTLLVSLPVPADSRMMETARLLDDFQEAVLAPEERPEGLSFQHLGPLQSDQAIQLADEILSLTRSRIL
jgi:HEPN domain-containing protein